MSGVGAVGHAADPALPAPRFFSHGGKQYGSSVVDHLNHTLAGRSAHLGLSLVWLCSLGHFRSAADYYHRAASYWPHVKGVASRCEAHPFIPPQPV